MKKNQLVSIIVPMYNSEKYIDQCINSIINQDYKNIELILIDDGSSDNTLKKVKEYSKKDKRIRIIEENNSGVSVARNNGIKESKGDLITFIDSDDFIEKDYISNYVRLINETGSDIVLSRMPIKYKSTNKERIIKEEEKTEIITGEEAALEMLYYKIFISSWNKLFKKSLIIENNILFNKNIHFGEGFNFSIDTFLKAKKVCITSVNKYYYRVDNENSVMTKFSINQINGSIDAQKHLQEKYDKINNNISKGLKYANWHTHCDCLNSIIGTCNKDFNKKLYIRIKKEVKKGAKNAIQAPIPIKEKMKALFYMINPEFAANIINKLRKRKFKKK